MDWNRSKKILIIALLMANILLFFYLNYNNIRFRDESETKQFRNNVISLLKDDKIKIDTDIPKKGMLLPSVLVELQTSDAEELNSTYFGGKGKIKRPSTDRTEISYKDEYINLVNNKRIYYENRKFKKTYELRNLDEVQGIVEEFMTRRKYDMRNMALSYFAVEDGKYILNYTKRFENLALESSYTNFIIDERGVASMDRLWLNVIDKSDTEIYLSPASEALLSLADTEDAYGKTITKISPCFYFNPEDQGYIEDITRAVKGRAIPAWKIEYSDGDFVVVDNY
ncbi:hypothetical protein [Peptoniphilus sp.]|jgi:regulatory protein YycI of two-component signal transduction system YycFG|uniref:hypothetical protein n=1 Tax=Peptoniphilus sp. TaxID=1971214 RepID=UPI003D8C8F67